LEEEVLVPRNFEEEIGISQEGIGVGQEEEEAHLGRE
jgi:hypothetical protein